MFGANTILGKIKSNAKNFPHKDAIYFADRKIRWTNRELNVII